MLGQDTKHAEARILVEEAFDPLDRLVQRPRHRVDRSEAERWVHRDERTNLGALPLRDLAIRQRYQLDARWNGSETRPAEEHAGWGHAADDLFPAHGHPARSTVPLEDERQGNGLSLSIDVVAWFERSQPHDLDERVDRLSPAARQNRHQKFTE
jgi:hypothetical protein